ncbi:MAG: helix-turn-helix domain-containing protein [Novosphingobium sp.]
MASVVREKKIKSADRVLEILELFDRTRQLVTVMDVSRALGLPQSSTSELLGSLVRQGYLYRDRFARTYMPTARVALLGAWVQPSFFRQGRLLPLMDDVVEESGHVAILGAKTGVVLRHVHVVGEGISPALRMGTDHSLLHSPLGKVLLSTFDWEIVRQLVHRINAETEAEAFVRVGSFLDELGRVRAQGFAVGYAENGETAIVAMLLPQSGEEQLALGIAMPREEIADGVDGYVRLLRGAVASRLGPMLAHSNERPRYARVI